jgi:antitoxin component YwqK of YwqJK toxin-antitoxin module
MAEGTFVNQKKDGVWLYYSDIDGKKVAQENYSMDMLDGRKISFYPESGDPAEIVYYKEGIKDGAFQKFYDGGKVMVAGIYESDVLDGEYTVYYENGQVEIHGYYSKGLQIGNWEYFDESGKTISEDEYREEDVPLDKFPEKE